MLNLLKLTLVLLFAGFVAAQVPQTVYQPNSTNWWVLGSDNVLSWVCGPSSHPTFAVSITNKNSKTPPLNIISELRDDVCSKLVDKTLIQNQPEGTGYTIIFSNPVNLTDVWATSGEFEIKPIGALFPSQVQSSASSSASGPAATLSGHTSGSISVKAGLGAVGLAAFAIVAVFI